VTAQYAASRLRRAGRRRDGGDEAVALVRDGDLDRRRRASRRRHRGARPVGAIAAVDDDLRRVAEAGAVARLLRRLARGERRAREAILPAEPVPVVDVEGEGDHRRIGLELRQPAIGGRARVAALRRVELDHRGDLARARRGAGVDRARAAVADDRRDAGERERKGAAADGRRRAGKTGIASSIAP
jgi:hypothetical protein